MAVWNSLAVRNSVRNAVNGFGTEYLSTLVLSSWPSRAPPLRAETVRVNETKYFLESVGVLTFSLDW